MDSEKNKSDEDIEWTDDELLQSCMDTLEVNTDKTINDKDENQTTNKDDGGSNKCVKDQEDSLPKETRKKSSKKKARNKSTKKRAVKRKITFEQAADIFNSENEYDDSDQDATYVPKKSDINPSDSENETEFSDSQNTEGNVSIKKKKQQLNSREKAWKKKRKTIKRTSKQKNKNPTPLHAKLKKVIKHKQLKRKNKATLSPQRAQMRKALLESMKEKTLRQIREKYHTRRLDLLLQSNDLKRVPVAADGNCFFAAVLKSMKSINSADELRESLSCHLIENKEHYYSFLPTNLNTASDEEKSNVYQEQINAMMDSGTWNISLGDCLPAALANHYQCTVRIFSSRLTTPVYDFKPTILQKDNDQNLDTPCIYLAYMAIANAEHYNGVVNIHESINDDSVIQEESINTDKEMDNDQMPSTDDINETPILTPHKRAKYQSPKRKQSTRKRLSKPEAWKRNIRKQKRCSGKEYTSCNGKIVKAKSLQPIDCTKCRFKCTNSFSDEERQNIFETFYTLGSYERKCDFICHMVESVTPLRSKGKRSFSNQFFLTKEGMKHRVCREFFLRTLDIGKKTVEIAMLKKKYGSFSGNDKRGKQSSSNKTRDDVINNVHKHIQSFPKLESHYSRKSTAKQYLSHDLNVKKMATLCEEECKKKGLVAVKPSKYRQIFCNEYNLSFYKPKKDQCSLCNLYESRKISGTLDEETEKKYNEHIERKVEARVQKEQDKQRSKHDPTIYVATFDLQAVLTTPCSMVGELYYSRKLCCYNLSIYSLGDAHGVCHVWDETQGARGSNEIATCLLKNTTSVCLSSRVKEITYYSDTCGGQNRNQFLAASLLLCLEQNQSVEIINHKFLQSGHSQMECDSIHSTIENAKKNTSVFVPSQWNTVIAMARKKNPYVVIPMKFGDVMDFKQFVQKHCPNTKVASTGLRVNWLQIRWIQVRRESPKSLFVNYSFAENSFLEIKVQSGTRGRQIREMDDAPRCYTSKLPISTLKKRDLVKLCDKGIIPEEFHSYYHSMLTAANTKDRIPSPGSDESDDTDSE